jgi:hypothetical protein
VEIAENYWGYEFYSDNVKKDWLRADSLGIFESITNTEFLDEISVY